MKDNYPNIGLIRFCRLFGITRQAYYQHFWQHEDIGIEQEMVIKQVLKIRENHCRMGGRKLYEKLQSFMLEHQIKMGRDALFDLLSVNKLLVKKRKRKVHTTQSFHWLKKHPNLIKNLEIKGPNHL